jgi:hypothetical protein
VSVDIKSEDEPQKPVLERRFLASTCVMEDDELGWMMRDISHLCLAAAWGPWRGRASSLPREGERRPRARRLILRHPVALRIEP